MKKNYILKNIKSLCLLAKKPIKMFVPNTKYFQYFINKRFLLRDKMLIINVNHYVEKQ
jgi:hypothetical protein